MNNDEPINIPDGSINIVITKEVVVEDALRDACIARSNGRYISAHLLANAACEVVRHLTENYTGLSVVNAYWSAIKSEEKSEKEAVRTANQSYNFFKHSDKDFDKELIFDPKLTDHLIYLCALDLNRLKCSGLEIFKNISLPEELNVFIEQYMFRWLPISPSLVEIENFYSDDSEKSKENIVSHIVEWLKKLTNFKHKPT